jgi:DnaJ homolog subfamily A member 5
MVSDVSLPSFGYSAWSWTPARKSDEDTAARTFYNAWMNFATEKDFVWCDQWNVSEAPDRRVRRCVFSFVIIPEIYRNKADGERQQKGSG